MAADRTGTRLEEHDINSSDLMLPPEHGCNIPKRHARVTVKYNRKELQKRLDVEKWIDDSLDRLYSGQVGACVRQQAALKTLLRLVCFLKYAVWYYKSKSYRKIFNKHNVVYTF